MKYTVKNLSQSPLVVAGIKINNHDLFIPPTEDPSAPSVVIVESDGIHSELLQLQQLGFVEIAEFTVVRPPPPPTPPPTPIVQAAISSDEKKTENKATVGMGHSKTKKVSSKKRLDPKYFPPGHPIHKALEEPPPTETTTENQFSDAFIDIRTGANINAATKVTEPTAPKPVEPEVKPVEPQPAKPYSEAFIDIQTGTSLNDSATEYSKAFVDIHTGKPIDVAKTVIDPKESKT